LIAPPPTNLTLNTLKAVKQKWFRVPFPGMVGNPVLYEMVVNLVVWCVDEEFLSSFEVHFLPDPLEVGDLNPHERY
jgi:hypothetical protein